MSGLSFGQDAEGNWGYIPSGADTVIPFNNVTEITCPFIFTCGGVNAQTRHIINAPEGKIIDTISFVVTEVGNYASGANYILQLSDGSYLNRFESSNNWPAANHVYKYTPEIASTSLTLIINRVPSQTSPITTSGSITVSFK